MYTYSAEGAARLAAGLSTLIIAPFLIFAQLIWFLILPFCFKKYWRKYRWKGIFPCLVELWDFIKTINEI